jgi:predicted nucleic acid-binding protein
LDRRVLRDHRLPLATLDRRDYASIEGLRLLSAA